ncbi:DNA double-strand break repair Rad50 ATPase [Methanosarcina lacustris Z-7289]|uniref:DNA double-strand break repair Rad50 ATPase n=1 Tax=Methanosarcina lacustris Z-7289 TaxID=1434111 RepID=A0A0E3S4P4_9EURY|nr:AAA family ATPase [Methanosarcina lacustris]AKB75206.1 DNA double-strand break repair Rad50 ATPase [Methanosarcina lacustris Z-7289]
MEINAIHIDGFGKFSRLSIEDLPSGLVIFTGANEAGKSTLFTFIRRMFFGIPNTRCNLYPPLEGGKHGGRLAVIDSAGDRWVIERNAGRKDDAKVVLPDGNAGGRAELLKLLGHADRNVFENIYAFGLEELQSFETLNNQSINSKLYSAGTGVGVSISGLMDSISSSENNLYKPRGSKPLINELFREIGKTEEKIAEFEGAQKKYDSLHFELEQRTGDIDQLKEKSLNIRNKLNHIQNLLSVWEDWRALQESKTALEGLPGLESFPEKGEEKLTRLREKIEEIKETISRLEQELEKNAVKERSLSPDESLLGQKDAVLELESGLGKYRSEVKNLPSLEINLSQEEAGLSELLMELGPKWNEEALDHFDRSIPAKETVIQMRRSVKEIEDQIKETGNELQQILNSIERVSQENDSFEESLLVHRTQVIELGNGIEKYRTDKDLLHSETREVQDRKAELKENLSGLGEGWDESTLARFERSTPSKETVIGKRREMEEAEKTIERYRDRLELALGEIKEVRGEIEALEEKLEAYSKLPNPEEVKQGLEAVSYLRVNHPLLREKESEFKNLEKDLEKEEMLFAAFGPRKTEYEGGLPLWPAGMLLIAGGIGLVYEYMNNSLLSGLGIFILLFATSAAYFLKARKKPSNPPVGEEQLKGTEARKQKAQDSKEKLSGEIASLKEYMKTRAKKCGFEDIPDPSVREQKADELQRVLLDLKTAGELHQGKEKLQKKRDKLNAAYQELEGKLKVGESRQEEVLQEWKEWLVSSGFKPELSPEHVLELLSGIRACLENQKNVKELEKQVHLREAAIKKYEEEALGVLGACERPVLGIALESEIAKLREDVSFASNQAERMRILEVESEDLNRKKEELKARLLEERTQRDTLSEKWTLWLGAYGLDPSLSVESVLEIFSVIRTCFDRQRAIRKLEEQIASSRTSIEAYEAKVTGVLQECGRPFSGLSFDTRIEKLRLDLEQASEETRSLQQLKTRSKELDIELQAARDKYEDAAKELAVLLESGSAATEEVFCENARLRTQRTELERGEREAEQQILRISGDGEKYDIFIEELQASDPLGLEEENRRLEEGLKTLEQETTENMDRRGAIGNQIEQLEHGSEGSLARVMQESLLEGLHEKSREWASLVLARKVLAKAIEVYEKERQPAVIVESQAFFSKITGGRYTRIYSPLNSSEIYVEDREGHHKSVPELSRGTAEQLYLSLRFGFIREFGRHSESLPVVFDDVLVNFDPERCKNTCEAIKDLVSGNQVFYFTCHPETVQMLVERFPEARAVDLEKVA